MKFRPLMLSLLLAPVAANALPQKLDACSRTGENPLWSLVLHNQSTVTPAKVAAHRVALPDDELTNAAIFGYTKLLAALLTKKQLVKQHGGDALSAAATMGRLSVSRMLLEDGISANAVNKMDTTALYGAVQYGCTEELKLLVSYGADINYRGPYSVTPMIEAVTDHHFKTAAVLLDNGYRISPTELTTIKNILLKQGNFSVWQFLFADPATKDH